MKTTINFWSGCICLCTLVFWGTRNKIKVHFSLTTFYLCASIKTHAMQNLTPSKYIAERQRGNAMIHN